ncbi:MAG TPA: fumarate hydratase [Thermotogota bacterium]|nr:fumarate hydratase [Thermotogota bacterium]
MFRVCEQTVSREMGEALVQAQVSVNPFTRAVLERSTCAFSGVLLENVCVARETGLPLCQDTGMVVFFVERGNQLQLDFSLRDVLQRVVENVFASNPFRFSTVTDPLFDRKNPGNNLPAVIHERVVAGTDLSIHFLVKGGGSENLSKLWMMRPGDGEKGLVDAVKQHLAKVGAAGCPPLHVGIGVGGTADEAMEMSKRALLLDPGQRNPDPRYAALEKRLEGEIEQLHLGVQGLGHGPSCLGVHVLQAPTHIATLPVGLSADCFLMRKGNVCFRGQRT